MLSAPLNRSQVKVLMLFTMAWIVRNTFFIRARSGDVYSSVDQAAMIQIVFVFIIGLVILTSKPILFWNDLRGTSGRWWIALYLFGIISYFWSNNPSYSVYRSLEYLILSVALMILILNSVDERTAERNLLLMSWSVLACEVLAHITLNGFSLTGMKSNSYGATAAMIACYSWGEAFSEVRQSSKRGFIVSGIISTFFVFNSLSTASWWALLIGCSFIVLLSRRKVLFVPIFLLLIVTLTYVDQSSLDQIVYRQKAGLTFKQALTSRDILWTDYWFAFQEKPLFGYGFGMASREVGHIYTTNTHNFIFAIAVGLGTIGLAIFTFYLVELLIERRRYLKFASISAIGLFAALTAGFVNGMSYSFIGENWVPSSCVFCCLFSLHLYHYLAINNPYYTLSNDDAFEESD